MRSARPRALLDQPERAVEQALAPVVAQAHEFVAGKRQRIIKATALTQPPIVRAPRRVAAYQHLIGVEHALRIERAARHHLGLAVGAGNKAAAFANVHRQPHDRIVSCLAVHFGQHHVGGRVGEIAAALDRRKLRRIAQHQERHRERLEIAPELVVDHRAFVDHDQLRFGGRRLVPQLEARLLGGGVGRLVDQAVNG